MIKMTAAAPRIAYEDLGQGEPVLLFLPGWVSDHTQVDPTARLCGRTTAACSCSTGAGTGGRSGRRTTSGMTRWLRTRWR